jgi:uroporphyrinogen-III synthase
MPLILNTRPTKQAKVMQNQLLQAGIHSIIEPVLNIKSYQEGKKLLLNIDKNIYDLIIFTSANAVWQSKDILKLLNKKIIVATGPATKEALNKTGIENVILPNEYNVSSMINIPKIRDEKNLNILVITGKNPKINLTNYFDNLGHKTKVIPVYERVPATTFNYPKRWNKHIDAIIVFSCESLNNLDNIIKTQNLNDLRKKPLIVLNDKIRKLAIKLGFNDNVLVLHEYVLPEGISLIGNFLARTKNMEQIGNNYQLRRSHRTHFAFMLVIIVLMSLYHIRLAELRSDLDKNIITIKERQENIISLLKQQQKTFETKIIEKAPIVKPEVPTKEIVDQLPKTK